MYRLNGATGDKTGLGITLKVMTGDAVNIFAKSFWHNNGATINNGNSIIVNNLLTALAGTSAVANAGKGATAITLTGSTVTPGDVTGWLANEPAPGSLPKAYLNWILFDEQFRVVSSSSGFDMITVAEQIKAHAQTVTINKNGYLYVYCSNESNIDVFFDNLQVIQTRGPVLSEDHYYPFGLTMSGISSKAAGKLENRYKYNGGTERNVDFDINLDETDFRLYDAQIGKFLQIDPLVDFFESYSPYTYVVDNPISYADPLGLSVEKPKVQKPTLPEVIVVSHKHPKKNPLSAGTVPGKLPNIKPKVELVHSDNLANKSAQPFYLPNKSKVDYAYKDFLEMVGTAAEHGELITEVTGSEELKNVLKGAGYVATATTFGYQLMQRDYVGAGWTGVEATLSAAVPEYNVFKIGTAIFTSKFTLSQAYFDAQASKMDLINKANQWPLGSDNHNRLIKAANEEHLAMIGLIQMRLNQLSNQTK